MKLSLKAALLLTFLFTLSQSSKAQYTYAGIDLSYHNVRFDSYDGVDGATRLNSFTANLSLNHRFVRHFGAGIRLRVPVYQTFKYQHNVNLNEGPFISDESVDYRYNYSGGEMYYFIESKVSFALVARLYFDVENNWFFDLRYVRESYEESFRNTPISSLASEAININRNVTCSGYGFSLGYQPRISDHFYFRYIFTVDFIGTDETPFTHQISGTSGRRAEIRSKIDDSQTHYEFSAGIGYIF